MTWQQDVSGAVVFFNAAWFEFTKLPRTPWSFTAEAWETIVHPDDMTLLLDTLSAATTTRSAFEIKHRVKPFGSSDAHYRWLDVRAFPISIADEFRGWIGSYTDVQERRVLEDARKADEFQALGESIPQIFWTATADGWIDWYNHKWYDYTGQTPAEAAGWGWQAVHHPQDFPKVMLQWPDSIATGKPFEMEFRLRGADGSFRWFLTRVHPYKDEHGRVARWFGTNTDIDEQRRDVEKTQRIAETLQRAFLPDRLPNRPSLQFDATYIAAEDGALVGGDWYDAFDLPDGRIVISIGDVAGHGLEASVIAGRLRQLIFAETLDLKEPAEVLEKADRVLRAQGEIIATAFVGYLDPLQGTLLYANAGHPGPIIAGLEQAPNPLITGDPPLGTGFISQGLHSSSRESKLPERAVIVCYTDGLLEFARNLDEAQQRLHAVVERIVAGDVSPSAKVIFQSVLQGQPAADDVAILLMSRFPEQSKPLAIEALTKTWRFHSSHALSAQTSRLEIVTFLAHNGAPNADTFESEVILGELLARAIEQQWGVVEIVVDWRDEKPLITFRQVESGLPRGSVREVGFIRELGNRLVDSLAQRFTETQTDAGSSFTVILPLDREM